MVNEKTYRIAVIPGDGIGKEVIPVGIRVLEAAGERFGFRLSWVNFPWGSDQYLEHGSMMADGALDELRTFEALYLGAVGHPDVPDHITLNGLLLPIRREFDQWACVRPSILHPGVTSPLAGKKAGDIDLVVVRENTEGEYSQIGGNLYAGGADEVALQTAVFTRKGTERIMRFAFELTRQRGKKRLLTSVTKSNAQGYSMAFWDRVFKEVAADFPDIRTQSLLVDAACMDLIRRPESFDVIVASNLFGDILTDMSAMITGSLGLGASANLNPDRTSPSMFEPVHGSAPDIVGTGRANPLATVVAGAMMLNFLGETQAARRVEAAVIGLLEGVGPLTPDLGGTASTDEVGAAVVERVSS